MKEAELIAKLKELQAKIKSSWDFLEIDKKTEELRNLEILMNQPDFWQEPNQAKKISQKASSLKIEIETWQEIKAETNDLLELAQMDQKDQTINLRLEVEEKFQELEQKFADLEFYLLFRSKYDRNNAILAIHSGTGGVDAQDWAEILLRMYLRFCEKKGFPAQILNINSGSEAGIKSAVLEVAGNYAYGNLKSEHGVHRLVRISPFDAEAMRHTSFALVEVIPELDDESVSDIKIKAEDLKIDTFRASGHGGQSVNKTDSAVRITHLPTKIVVSCQSERSQLQNKERALKILKSKLQKLAEAEKEEEKKQLRGEFSEAVWGNQIRSYVMQPYQLVKDHRTKYEEKDIQSVLDGNLDGFIEAYLKSKS
ncbi:MAG TPA: peptide chain release factor 2 [Candidatus Uhrbacteria bacterium]|nr:peptide chain release factor 2 [Candidatus Uhrbacteria bacterium]